MLFIQHVHNPRQQFAYAQESAMEEFLAAIMTRIAYMVIEALVIRLLRAFVTAHVRPRLARAS